MQHLLDYWTGLPWVARNLLTLVMAVVCALVAHRVVIGVLQRIAARTPDSVDDTYVASARRPMQWIAVAFALVLVRRAMRLDTEAALLWIQVAGLVVPALIGWLAVAMVRATEQAVTIRADISVADNLRARRKRTRAAIMSRITIIVICVATIALMLLSIPSVRSIGLTLMASAGIAGLAVGAAAQPALKNLIAGIQMAFTEPIRLDDVVIVEGEWGKIEEIRLTYVVVALWDERRLVVPVSRFLEQPFQNWTRNTSQLLGSAFLYLDPTADIARLRAAGERLVEGMPRWDRRAFALQVTDMKADAIEVRVLATARDAPSTFDLRCDIREALLAYIRDEMPGALPHRRLVSDLDHAVAHREDSPLRTDG